MPDGPLRLLLLEDTPEDALLVHEAIALIPSPQVEVLTATSLADALALLTQHQVDLVLSDLDVPDSKGLATYHALAHAKPDLLIVILTHGDGHEIGAEAVRLGAQDHLDKASLSAGHMHRTLRYARGQRKLFHRALAARTAAEEANRKTVDAYDRLAHLEHLRDGLVHMIVHDLRSPLSSVCGYQDLFLRRSGDVDPKLRGMIVIAKSQAVVLTEMVSSILDISKMEAGELVPVLADHDLTALAGEAVEQVRGGALNHEITVTPTPAAVRCDGELIKRAIVNLVANAVKHGAAGTVVTVTVSIAANRARLEVGDCGAGIPLDAQARLFDKFASIESGPRRPYSTGLGLHFCKLAIEAHGGLIGVDSAPGKGTRFWFDLPCAGLKS